MSKRTKLVFAVREITLFSVASDGIESLSAHRKKRHHTEGFWTKKILKLADFAASVVILLTVY